MTDPVLMLRPVLSVWLMLAACGPVEQPKWAVTVAAFEVPLPTPADKKRFIDVLTGQAKASGFHVDAATEQQLKVTSEISPQTMNATVWRGENDDEPIASAMDFQDHLGRVWITFSLGQDADRSRRFREALVPAIKKNWPDTAALPIMPTGAIPLARDLIRTPSGYVVKPSAEPTYQRPAT